MGRKPTVGEKAPKSAFASDLHQYLMHIYTASGLTAREASDRTGGQRGKSWWGDLVKGTKILTTNDIQMIADMLGMTPYQFVRNAKDYAQNVGGSEEDGSDLPDEVERKMRQTEHDLAATEGRNEAETPTAE